VVQSARLDDLRRRIQKDPASLAFAQLAEELRRQGSLREAVQVSRAGLEHHPTYWSARVTLGRALLALDRLGDAHDELSAVLRAAPENLAARRGVAEIHERRGELTEALVHYRAARALARHDTELAALVARLEAEAARQAAPTAATEAAETGPAEPVDHTAAVPGGFSAAAPWPAHPDIAQVEDTQAWPPASSPQADVPGGEFAPRSVSASLRPADAKLLASLEGWLRAILDERTLSGER
jgi:tetratricopeptide (TPR) repeat protein